jgi:sugar lactone lactonase YvrE
MARGAETEPLDTAPAQSADTALVSNGARDSGAPDRFEAKLAADAALDSVFPSDRVAPDAASPSRKLALVAGALGGFGSQDGVGAAARFYAPADLVNDGQGNLFVADTKNSTIRRIDQATGRVSTLAGSPGRSGVKDGVVAEARFMKPVGLALDGQGNLFVADSIGSTIRKVEIATGAVSTLAGAFGRSGGTDGVGSQASFISPRAVLFDGNGGVLVGDGHAIRKVDVATGAVSTIAGSLKDFGNVDGVGKVARFTSPRGLAHGAQGVVFVADENCVRKLVLETLAVTTVAGSKRPGSADDLGSAASFNNLMGLVGDDAGSLIVADYGNGRLRRIDLASGAVSSLVLVDLSYVGATSLLGRMYTGVVMDGPGKILATEESTSRVMRIDLVSGKLDPLAGASRQTGSEDGAGAAARFLSPWSVTADGNGNLYVADWSGATIRKLVMATGEVTTLAGSPGQFQSTDGIGPAARFATAMGLATDGAASLFVADMSAHTIRKIDLGSNQVSVLAGATNQSGSSDGPAQTARFNGPAGLAYQAGQLFIADSMNYTVRKLDLQTGEVTTLAGTVGQSGQKDGVGSQVLFGSPQALVVDGVGHLFVSEGGQGTIRRVDIASATVSTLAAYTTVMQSETSLLGGSSAPQAHAGGLAYDGAGGLYVANATRHMVHKIDLQTDKVTGVVGALGRPGVLLGDLPGQLTEPTGLVFIAPNRLAIADHHENALLMAEF